METEIFPQMAAEGNLYALPLDGYWKNIGRPKVRCRTLNETLYLNFKNEAKRPKE
jgi:mannose-1-phosphate guanylyltransferase